MGLQGTNNGASHNCDRPNISLNGTCTNLSYQRHAYLSLVGAPTCPTKMNTSDSSDHKFLQSHHLRPVLRNPLRNTVRLFLHMHEHVETRRVYQARPRAAKDF